MTKLEWDEKFVHYHYKKTEANWNNNSQMEKYYQKKLDDLDNLWNPNWCLNVEEEE